MSVNGIGTAGYQMTGYTARKMERSAEPGTVGFMETVEEKAAQGRAADQDEKAFEMVGRGAPQEVKDAWMDAAKEVNANGMGIRGNGMMSHISQMMVQRLNKQLKGETENFIGRFWKNWRSYMTHIPDKSQPDKEGQASPAFRQIGESYNKNVEECKMFDFIIEMIADIAEIFVDLWVNKVINRKKKCNIDSEHISQ